MKKFFTILLVTLGSFAFMNASAQQKKPVKKVSVSAKTKMEKTKAKTTEKKEKAEKKEEAHKTMLKKNGTPDMRYKANKEAAKKSAGPLKKNGTPDMRYKANKEKAKAK